MRIYQVLMVLTCLMAIFVTGLYLTNLPPPKEIEVSPPESSFDVMSSGQGRYFDVMVMKDKLYNCEFVVVRYVSGIAVTPRLQGNGLPYCGKWKEPK